MMLISSSIMCKPRTYSLCPVRCNLSSVNIISEPSSVSKSRTSLMDYSVLTINYEQGEKYIQAECRCPPDCRQSCRITEHHSRNQLTQLLLKYIIIQDLDSISRKINGKSHISHCTFHISHFIFCFSSSISWTEMI